MDRLRILFLSTWYPSGERPVVGAFVQEFARAVQLYDDVVVLHSAGRKAKLQRLWQVEQETDQGLSRGIPTYRIWHRTLLTPQTEVPIRLWAILGGFQHIVAQGFSPHIIHAHVYTAGAPAVLLARLHSKPLAITEHSTAFPRKALGHLRLWTARFALNHADVVLPVSTSLQRAIEEYGIRTRFQVVPNVVDTGLFFPDPGRAAKTADQTKRLLAVGLLDLTHKKGIPYLLTALARLQERRADWHLDLIGDGPARPEYEQMATSLGLAGKVTFHGLKSREEVADFMRRADLFIVPSLFETFSVVTAEAQASGLPVLATRCGGPEELVTDESGTLIRAGDADALYEGLCHMLDNLSRYSSNDIARGAEQRFSVENVGAQLHEIYCSLLREETGGRSQ